ncbi:unnamed protein product [Lathyrus sativus]|nr:unnamed protein product [Lathyrus sativus]
MARRFEMINDITDHKDLWKLAVKIYHKWKVITATNEHFEMVVVNKQVTYGLQIRKIFNIWYPQPFLVTSIFQFSTIPDREVYVHSYPPTITGDITLTDITFCVSVATTDKLIASSNGWHYRACHQCSQVAKGDKPSFFLQGWTPN